MRASNLKAPIVAALRKAGYPAITGYYSPKVAQALDASLTKHGHAPATDRLLAVCGAGTLTRQGHVAGPAVQVHAQLWREYNGGTTQQRADALAPVAALLYERGYVVASYLPEWDGGATWLEVARG